MVHGWGGNVDGEAFAASAGDVDRFEFAALDLVQHGLAGAAERAGGVGEREIAVGDVGHEASADLVGELVRQGADGALCSPGSRPSLSQRRIVNSDTPSSAAAWLMVTSSESGSGGGAAGMPARWRAERTREAVNDSPVAVRWLFLLRIEAIWWSG